MHQAKCLDSLWGRPVVFPMSNPTEMLAGTVVLSVAESAPQGPPPAA